MDPRYLRSQTALRTAVHRLASEQSISEISVAQLCREAGVTRDTFYRHASSPLVLLADMLGSEIERVVGAYQNEAGAIRDGADFPAAERALLAHVVDNIAVYRAAMEPRMLAPLRHNFEHTIRLGLLAYLGEHPEILPAGVAADDESAARLLASYAASGTVGAIESWVLDAEPGVAPDIDRGVRLILAASPQFWLGMRS